MSGGSLSLASTPHDAEWLEFDDDTRPPSPFYKEPKMLVKHAIVLNRSEEPSSDRNVLYRPPADEAGNPRQTKLWLDQEIYIELGGPAVVTLAIEPGDSLNSDAP